VSIGSFPESRIDVNYDFPSSPKEFNSTTPQTKKNTLLGSALRTSSLGLFLKPSPDTHHATEDNKDPAPQIEKRPKPVKE
jgi:hypothetical protein